MPFGIHQLENFLSQRVKKNRRISEGTQTHETAFIAASLKRGLKLYRSDLELLGVIPVTSS